MAEKVTKLADCDALILCGGEGTRIRHLLPEGCPKVMADVNGTPFLRIFVDHLIDTFGQFSTFIFATGYGEAKIRNYVETVYRPGVHGCRWWKCIDEARPLGTAGAIRNAVENNQGYPVKDPFFIFNGDTWADLDYAAMLDYHIKSKSVVTVAHDDRMRHVGTFVASRRLVGLIPEAEGKYDMEELFTLLGKLREPVGWFRTEAKFYDIGTEIGLKDFRRFWSGIPIMDRVPKTIP